MPKFKKVSADEARAKRNDHVRSGANGEVMVKGFKAPPSWNKEQRSARFIMTSETVDRYGDIVVQNGLDITRFLENPQGLLFHNSRTWPAGNWTDVTKVLSGRPKRTEGTFNFLPEGTDEDADRAARHVAAGSIRTVSIGFAPDWDSVELILDDDEEWVTGLKFNASELLECSLVPIPAQPDALVKDVGGDFRLARDLIEEVLDTYAKTPEGLLIPMDEYRAKHMDLVPERSFHIIKGLEREPKAISRADAKMSATTDAEAAEYVGQSVLWDPAHPEFKDVPEFFLECAGEVIASYIVDSGEFKGVHGLAVEWTDKEGRAVGMFRGLKAERVLLAKMAATDSDAKAEEPVEEAAAKDDDEPECEPMEDAEKTFTAFVAELEAGDVLTLEAGVVEAESKNGYRSFAKSETGGTFTMKKTDGSMLTLSLSTLPANHREIAEARIAELKAADVPENKTETPKPIVVSLSVDTAEAEAAVTKVEGLFGRLAKQFPLFFPKAIEERIEPTFEPPAPAEPPSAEAIAAALAKAAGTRERLAAKGLIAA